MGIDRDGISLIVDFSYWIVIKHSHKHQKSFETLEQQKIIFASEEEE